MNCLGILTKRKQTRAEIADEFFLNNTPEAFKKRFLEQAKGDVVKAKTIEEEFHYKNCHDGKDKR